MNTSPHTVSEENIFLPLLRESRSLSGPWQVGRTCAGSLDQLAKATLSFNEQVEIPFLEARSGSNAMKLRKAFLFHPQPGRRVFLRVGAAKFDLKVLLNGHEVGRHTGGYTPFRSEITDLLQAGENELIFCLIGEQAVMDGPALRTPVGVSSATLRGYALERWQRQTGMDTPPFRIGIWQDVTLEICPEQFIEYVKVTPDTASGLLNFSGAVCGSGPFQWAVQIAETDICLEGGTDGTFAGSLDASTLEMWSPDHPRLYNLVVQLKIGSAVIDQITVRFGYRQFKIRRGGFYLNGAPVHLRGESNLLQNRGLQFTNALSLENPKFWNIKSCKIYLQTLKEHLDINSIRVHGSIGHPAIFEAADEVGLLVESQSSIWSRGYGGYTHDFESFLDTVRRETSEWIRRDWNHPSVVMWGAENEMARIARTPEDANRFKVLEEMIQAQDDSRPVCFDGSSGSHCDFSKLYHLHHEENYEPFLREWKEDKPLVFGEFWVGSRGAEQRLTTGEEYFSADDYWNKQYRLWCRRIEPMRRRGVSGILPYNFSGQWITHWAGFESEYRRSNAGMSGDGLCIDSRNSCPEALPEVHAERARKWKHLLGRYCACFADVQRTFSDPSVRLTVALRNDHSEGCSGSVELLDETGACLARADVEVDVCETGHALLSFDAQKKSQELTLLWKDAGGKTLDWTSDIFFFQTLEKSEVPGGGTPVHVLRTSAAESYIEAFRQAGCEVQVHQPEQVEWELLKGGVLIADEYGLNAAGRWRQKVAENSVSLFLVEVGSNGPLFPGLNVFNFQEPLRTAWKFTSIVGRELTLAEMLLPPEGCWETADHPVCYRLNNPYWHASRNGEPIAHAALLYPGVEASELMKTVHGVGAGLDEQEEDNSFGIDGEQEEGDLCFRSLLTAVRREYSVLAEIQLGGRPGLVSTLKLSGRFVEDSRVTQLLLNCVHYLSNGWKLQMDETVERIEVLHNWTDAARSPHPALKLIPTPASVNLMAMDHRSVFGATKSQRLLAAAAPEFLICPEAGLPVKGGWLALEVNHCFEVSGPLFPWEFQSHYPVQHGYAGLAFVEDDTMKVYLVGNLLKPSLDSHLRHLLHQLMEYRQNGIDVQLQSVVPGTLVDFQAL